jgi:FAD/FMN-containing dehydrogenase
VPQGGNTGHVGGQIPTNGAPISCCRWSASTASARSIPSGTRHDGRCRLSFSLPPRSTRRRPTGCSRCRSPRRAPAEIGGNLSTNAGGTAVLAYGNMRNLVPRSRGGAADRRGLGRIPAAEEGQYRLRPRDLFIGAEGTLGIITAAVLRLFPRPRGHQRCLCIGLRASGCAGAARGQGLKPVRPGADGVRTDAADGGRVHGSKHMPACAIRSEPPRLVRADGYLVVAIRPIVPSGPIEAMLRNRARQRPHREWRPLPLARAGRSLLAHPRKHVARSRSTRAARSSTTSSVPVAAIPAFIARGRCGGDEGSSPARGRLPFGHMGDGNIHYNITQPIGADKAGSSAAGAR